MTNFEYWREEIKKITDAGCDLAVVDGKPASCNDTLCMRCDLGENSCGSDLIKWLYAEHIEKPKINKRTKAFFDAIETGWVCRDQFGSLYLTPSKPSKGNMYWVMHDNNIALLLAGRHITYYYDFLTLDFIKWEDNEPWSVEDIRNLEVV